MPVIAEAEIRQRSVWVSATSASDAVREYGQSTGQVFTQCGRSGRAAYFRCNRSYYRKVEAVESRLPKFASKNTACPVRLAVFSLAGEFFVTHTDGIERQHNHEIEPCFHRQTAKDRESMKLALRNGIPGPVLYKTQAARFDYNSPIRALRAAARCCSDSSSSESTRGSSGVRLNDRFSRAEIRRLERAVEKESYVLGSTETESLNAWILRLGERVLYHRSRLVDTRTKVVLQPFQLSLVSYLIDLLTDSEGEAGELATSPVSIDATFNVTNNPKMLLYSVISRDSHGHGIPIAHLLTDSKSSQEIGAWLGHLRARYPMWRPERVLTDTAPEQIVAIKTIFPAAQMLLCTWHVKESWRRMLGYTKQKGGYRPANQEERDLQEGGPESQDLLTPMMRLRDEPDVGVFLRLRAEFRILLADQKRFRRESLALPSLPAPARRLFEREIERIEYLEAHYIGERQRHTAEEWAHCYRTEATTRDGIRMDSTMLSEGYHHVLKYSLLKSPRLNRIDYVVKVLVVDSCAWFSHNRFINRQGRGRSDHTPAQRQEHAKRASFRLFGDDIEWLNDVECRIRGLPEKFGDRYIRKTYSVNIADSRFSCTCRTHYQSPGWNCMHIYAAMRSQEEIEDLQSNVQLAEDAGYAAAEIESWDPDQALQEYLANTAQPPEMTGSAVSSASDVSMLVDSTYEASQLDNVFDEPDQTFDNFLETQFPRANVARLRDAHTGARLYQQYTLKQQLSQELHTAAVSVEAGNRRLVGAELETSKNMRPKMTGRKRKRAIDGVTV